MRKGEKKRTRLSLEKKILLGFVVTAAVSWASFRYLRLIPALIVWKGLHLRYNEIGLEYKHIGGVLLKDALITAVAMILFIIILIPVLISMRLTRQKV